MTSGPQSLAAPDVIRMFKEKQKETWGLGDFGQIATFTTLTAGHLVRFAGIQAGESVLDVGTGTGVVAITAARRGARTTGLDLTPALLAKARESAKVCGADIRWEEGDAEALPFPDASFDVVLSQFGHMFAPRPEVATAEMLRVLKPGGRIAFATWPPEQVAGEFFAIGAKYVPPPPGIPPVGEWGNPEVVRARLGNKVKEIQFERANMPWIALSPQHFRVMAETYGGPSIRAVQVLQSDPARLAAYRKEIEELISRYLVDNVVRYEYLLSRAVKV
jgi:SAM-dependent methyltransferase